MSEINLKNNLAALTGLIFRNDKLCDNLATWHLQTGRNLINLRTRRSCTNLSRTTKFIIAQNYFTFVYN